jgi:hypothetical protein
MNIPTIILGTPAVVDAILSAPKAGNINTRRVALAPTRGASFKVGQTYSVRSLCDWDCIYRFIVTARTDKTVTVQAVGGPNMEPYGKPTRRTVRAYDGVETLKPHGSYSMSATLYADKVAE